MDASDPKVVLHRYLQLARDALVWKLDGLSEYDIRRPVVPTGTNLFGLIKHVASVELGYLGDTFGRPVDEPLPWFEDGPEPNADMWATAAESRDQVVALYHRAWGHSDSIFNQWGLTEFPAATSLAVGDPPEKFNDTAGRMAPGCNAKTVGVDGTITPTDVEGELWVSGPQRCIGYADSSLDDAFDDDGYFRTGDLGVIDDDGFVRITGRLKDIIIRNAENLSAQEIDDALIEHPAIADVAVIGLPDDRTGERACAVIVLVAGHESPTLRELADHCTTAGLDKQKVPEQIEIVEALPRNPMGKVLKHVLRSQLRDVAGNQ